VYPTPVAVIGSGLAGLLAATHVAQQQPVILLTKRRLRDSNTKYSQGGIAAVWSDEDSPAQHTEDTLEAGAGLCDRKAVEVLTENGKEAILKLIELGTNFDQDTQGRYLLGLEGAHSMPRILHAGGDATGAEIQRALMTQARQNPNIEIWEGAFVTEIVTKEGRVAGLRYHDEQTGEGFQEASQVILATGGAGQVYRYTSNPEMATGEGAVLAYLAGAELMDMEFFQFHPTALCLPNTPNFLISEAVRGEGAVLRNLEGEAFMENQHPLKDLAPRDIVARAITHEIFKRQDGQVFLDATGLDCDLETRFPTIFRTCLQHGIDIRKEGIPITPVAHYFMGGVSTDLWGRSSLPGLYACGEVARTGVHGSNRLASNSLLEGAVFALRVGDAVFEDQKQKPEIWERACSFSGEYPEGEGNHLSAEQFRNLMWENAGLIRTKENLQELLRQLAGIPYRFQEPFSAQNFELFAMKIMGKLIAEAALKREESRGGHYRLDFPLPRKEQCFSNTTHPCLSVAINRDFS